MMSIGSVPDVPRATWLTLGSLEHETATGNSSPSRVTPFTWQGSPWDIAGTCVLNTVLMLLTLGVYGFWGRTEIRRRLWSSIRLFGEPLVYHGTPLELLRGFFAVLAVVLTPLFVVGTIVVVYFGQASAVFGIYQFGLLAVLYPILAAVAFYRARRYRLSRTSWRGVRSSLTGSSTRYGAVSWLTASAYPLTLGWVAPYRAVALQRLLVSDTTIGNRPLRFVGRARSVYGRYALLWFGTVLLIGAVLASLGSLRGGIGVPGSALWWASIGRDEWIRFGIAIVAGLIVWSLMSSFYYASLYNHLARSTFIESHNSSGPPLGNGPGLAPVSVQVPLHFALDVSGRRLIWLFVTNSLITYLSLYILKPVATARTMKYYMEHLTIVGPFEPATFGQNGSALLAEGEGLAQAFDLDAF